MQVKITRCDSFALENSQSFTTVKSAFESYKSGFCTVSELVHNIEAAGFGVVSFMDNSITIDAEVKVNGIELLVNFTLTL